MDKSINRGVELQQADFSDSLDLRAMLALLKEVWEARPHQKIEEYCSETWCIPAKKRVLC